MITTRKIEPLLKDISKPGKTSYDVKTTEIPSSENNLNSKFIRKKLNLPELSEIDVTRHFTRLSTKNYGVDTGFYPLGSCTMKYNPKINEDIASMQEFTNTHPLFPESLVQGNLEILYHTANFLKEITGFSDITLNPAAGAHGELTGILMIKSYFENKNEKRTKILVPNSAHGTNPASAALVNYQTVEIKCNEHGILDSNEVEKLMNEEVAAIMITNPNTLGLFEEDILKIAEIVHNQGGLVYMDGANLNALMGITKIATMGVDLMHINLHKTFSTPHGGGGPGSGPLCVNNKLAEFLPVPLVIKEKDTFKLDYSIKNTIGQIGLFYGNFQVIIKALAYILTLGHENIKTISETAILCANYIKEKLKKHYFLPFDRDCMHECVFTDKYQAEHGVSTLNIAKALLDKGYHPPTVYFPLVVKNALMIEPTETESKETLDEFILAMIDIAKDAKENKESIINAPINTPVTKIDEVAAVKKMILNWNKL